MRTIKFRGRIPKKDGKVTLFYQENQYLMSFLRRLSSQIIWEQSGTEREHESYLEGDLESYLDRWTGLLDKNGKEIYEGDIMRGLTWKEPYAEKTSREITGNVCWNDYMHGWHIHSDLPNGFRTYLTFNRSEVIGNIHENPDLLK